MLAIGLMRRKGQIVKYWLGMALVAVSCVVSIAEPILINRLTSSDLVLLSVAGFAGLIYLCIAIRCPDCGARWFWLMASTRADDPRHLEHDVGQMYLLRGGVNTI